MKKYTQEAFAKLPLKGKLREFSDFMDKCGRPEDERDMSCRYVFQACTSVGITVEQLALHTTGWSINDIIGFYFDQDGKADNIACDGEIVKALKRFRVFMLCCKNGSFDWFHLEVTEKHWLTIGELVDYSSAGKELENDKPDRVLTITIRGRKCEIVEKDFVKPYQRRYPPFDINDRNYHDLLGLIFFSDGYALKSDGEPHYCRLPDYVYKLDCPAGLNFPRNVSDDREAKAKANTELKRIIDNIVAQDD